jgi:Spy/CpxP family protein refolding chaperone
MNMMRIFQIIILDVLLTALLSAQAKVTLPVDRDALTKGDPMGTTLVAENNLYPAPQKVIAYKDQLGLTKDQIQKIAEIVSNTTFSAAVKGSEIIEAEEGLNQLFETGMMNDRTLRAKLERIGILRADYSLLHLQAYVKIKKVLTPNQYERYKELVKSETK